MGFNFCCVCVLKGKETSSKRNMNSILKKTNNQTIVMFLAVEQKLFWISAQNVDHLVTLYIFIDSRN